MSTRILIVEDHPIVRQGYAQLIGGEPDLDVCGFAAGQQEAIEQIRALRPHLVIVDITLKEGYGLELVKQIHREHESLRVLVVSAHDEKLFAERVLLMGALGYVSKQEATEKLIEAIRCVLADEVYVSESIARRLLKRRVSGISHGHDVDPISSLSDRELEAFQLIGQGMTTSQIAKQMHVSSKTVERYKENIKQKVGLANATELLQRATQWRLEGG